MIALVGHHTMLIPRDNWASIKHIDQNSTKVSIIGETKCTKVNTTAYGSSLCTKEPSGMSYCEVMPLPLSGVVTHCSWTWTDSSVTNAGTMLVMQSKQEHHSLQVDILGITKYNKINQGIRACKCYPEVP